MGLETHILWPCEIVLLSWHVQTFWGSEGLPLWRAALTSFLCAPSTETASSSGDLFFVHVGFIYDMHLPAFSSLCSIRRRKKEKKKSTKKRSPWYFYKALSSSLYSGTDCHCKAWWIKWQSAVPASVSEHQQGEHPAHHLLLDFEERSSVISFFLFLSFLFFSLWIIIIKKQALHQYGQTLSSLMAPNRTHLLGPKFSDFWSPKFFT